MCEVFGPECRDILTGDKVQDARNAQHFATAMAEGCNQVKEGEGKITIEVNRDLREMSGKTAKEKAMDLGSRTANHHAVAEKLEKAFAEESNGKSIRITAGLIRKGRSAQKATAQPGQPGFPR